MQRNKKCFREQKKRFFGIGLSFLPCMALCGLACVGWPYLAFTGCVSFPIIIWMALYSLVWHYMVLYSLSWRNIVIYHGHRSKFIWYCSSWTVCSQKNCSTHIWSKLDYFFATLCISSGKTRFSLISLHWFPKSHRHHTANRWCFTKGL